MPDEQLNVMPSESPESLAEKGVAEEPPSITGTQPAQPPIPPTGSATPVITAPDVSDNDRLMAALAWFSMVILQLPIISVVLLLVEEGKSRPFQRYHAVTSIVFWIAAFVYEILAVIGYTTLTLVSLGCLGLCLWVVFFLPHLAALYYAYRAYQGQYAEIPVISDFARKQGWV